MSISLQTIAERHVGDLLMPMSNSLYFQAGVKDGTWGPVDVPMSDWYNPFTGQYIDVTFSTSGGGYLDWPDGWTNPNQAVQISGNCAWRIHPDTWGNLAGLATFDIQVDFSWLSKTGQRGYPSNAQIMFTANGNNFGQANFLIEYANGTGGYSILTIILTIGRADQFDLSINPSSISASCDGQDFNIQVSNVGVHSPSVSNVPSWITIDNITAPVNGDSNIFLTVHPNRQTCHPISLENRSGTLVISDSANNSVFLSVYQNYCYKTDPVWPVGSSQTVYDRDGNPYQYITIGEYQILLQNLRSTKYGNGDDIPQIYMSDVQDRTTHGYINPWNNSGLVPKGGRLYNYHTVAQSLLKEGFMDPSETVPGYSLQYQWHPPTHAEIIEIVNQIYLDAGEIGDWVEGNDLVDWITLLGNLMKCPYYFFEGNTFNGYPGYSNHDQVGNNDSKFGILKTSFVNAGLHFTGAFSSTRMHFWLQAEQLDENGMWDVPDDTYVMMSLSTENSNVFFHKAIRQVNAWTRRYTPPPVMCAIRLVRKHDL